MARHRVAWIFPVIAALTSVLLLGGAATALPPPIGIVPTAAGVTVPGLPAVTGHIHVDQFGYLPDESKIAVVADPRKGFNASEGYTPGDVLEVRPVGSTSAVFRGPAIAWNRGKVHADSGDRGWWFDFSDVSEPGDYIVFDPKNDRRSHVFHIGDDVYRAVLRAAVRTFYYQREATAHAMPWVEGPWIDDPMYLQDAHARALWAKDDPTTARDLHGGWMDAGDANKYVTFLRDVIHPLLYAWQATPAAFTDDTNIPESGNGRPDLLDEVMFELEWLVRMQDADGGFFIKMGTVDYAGTWPLSKDARPRYYGPKSSAATIVGAAILAHAARVYREFPDWKAAADDFAARAQQAWVWYHANPRSAECDSGEIKAGDADLDLATQDRAEAAAAMHLFALTGDETFHDVFRVCFSTMRQMQMDEPWSPYELGYGETLVDYTRLPKASSGVRVEIEERLGAAIDNPEFLPAPEASLYRSQMPRRTYHWGSNIVRAGYGQVALEAAAGGMAAERAGALRQRALDMLHSFHGVNPLGMIYLSNMGSVGGEVSVTRIWHDEFPNGSRFAANPPPGYVVGGPNAFFHGRDALDSKTSILWVRDQPPDKAYADTNVGHPQNSWEMCEPAIYYQAAYIRLLANFAPPTPAVMAAGRH